MKNMRIHLACKLAGEAARGRTIKTPGLCEALRALMGRHAAAKATRLTQKQIHAALILKGVRMIDVAREVGVSETAVRLVMMRKGLRSTRIRRALAQAIGRHFAEVWGEADPGEAENPRRTRRAETAEQYADRIVREVGL